MEYDKTSIPLMETNPPLRAPSHRRTARQFVRVYPTYPDISTSRPGVASGSQSSSDLSHLPYLSFPLALSPAFHPSFLRLFLHFFPPLLSSSLFLAISFRIFFHISQFTFSLLPFFLSLFFLISFFASSPSSLYSSHFSQVNSTLSHVSRRSLAKL